MITQLNDQMEQAATLLEFEKAAALRDQIGSLKTYWPRNLCLASGAPLQINIFEQAALHRALTKCKNLLQSDVFLRWFLLLMLQ
jgi:excinuclease UvrABC nuclease subunit